MSRNWLPFKRRELPVVKVRIGAENYLALVDTGASVCGISPNLALELGLPQEGKHPIISVHGQSIYRPRVTIPSVGFAELDLPKSRAFISNVSAIYPGLSLILGINAFPQHRVLFDFPEARVYVFTKRDT